MSDAPRTGNSSNASVTSNVSSTGARERAKSIRDIANQAEQIRNKIFEQRKPYLKQRNNAARQLREMGESAAARQAYNEAQGNIDRLKARYDRVSNIENAYMRNIRGTKAYQSDESRVQKNIKAKFGFRMLVSQGYNDANNTKENRKYSRKERRGQ